MRKGAEGNRAHMSGSRKAAANWSTESAGGLVHDGVEEGQGQTHQDHRDKWQAHLGNFPNNLGLSYSFTNKSISVTYM